MATPPHAGAQDFTLLTTKLYIPPPLPNMVERPRLVKRLDEGLRLGHKLTLVSAPAGFGKTTLLSEWIAGCEPRTRVAWLSLDEGDNDLARFLAYFVVALQTIEGDVGQGLLATLLSPGTINVEAVLTSLINEIAGLPDGLILVLDDYHVIESQPVDNALTFLLDHLPPTTDPGGQRQGMHLVIASRADPSLPLSRLRAGGQMTEIRVADLRFTLDEVAAFLIKATGLNLSPENVAALATRTEGWIAGLRLAALSMQGLKRGSDVTDFVNRFTGSHRYIQDYLADEVLQQRPKGTRDFLLQTSILDRLCGPLCDAVRGVSGQGDGKKHSQAILEALGAANLFIVPLDNERRWYRYHPLFKDLLRQRLEQNPPPLSSPPLGGKEGGNSSHPPGGKEGANSSHPPGGKEGANSSHPPGGKEGANSSPPPGGKEGGSSPPPPGGKEGGNSSPPMGGKGVGGIAELHIRASAWYEENGLEIEALHHAAAANDFERAARLVEGGGNPLYHRGAVTPVLNWLESLPTSQLDARPSLWVMYAEVLTTRGRLANSEEAYQAAEAALGAAKQDASSRDLLGRIANGHASLAGLQHQPERMIALARRALDLLHPDNLAMRAAASLNLGYAYQLQGDRVAAGQAFAEAITNGQTAGHIIVTMLATQSLGDIQAGENRLRQAAQTYRRALQLAGERPLPYVGDAHLGLARILYEWNDLDAAQRHGQQGLQLTRQIEHTDKSIAGEILLARLKLALGDVASAAAILDEASRSVQEHHYTFCMPEVAAAQVLALLRQGDLTAAAQLAQTHDLPISQARVHLAQADAAGALAVLEPLRRQVEAKSWEDERLKVMALQAVALHVHGETDKAVQLLGDALALAEPGGFMRTFVDEGAPMAQLLVQAAARGMMPDYTSKLLAAFEDTTKDRSARQTTELSPSSSALPAPVAPAQVSEAGGLVEPLSERELEVLQLIAQGLSNREISGRLFLALSTVKGHNRNIYGKLQVQRRTEAVARARELGLV